MAPRHSYALGAKVGVVRVRSFVVLLLVMVCAWCCDSAMAATSVTHDTSTHSQGVIPSLPGTEITPADMQKHFPTPLGGSAPSFPFMPDAAPLIPSLPLQGTEKPKEANGATQENTVQYPQSPKVEPYAPKASPTPPSTEKSTEAKALEERFRRALNPSFTFDEQGENALGQAVISTNSKPTGFPSLEVMLGQMLMVGFTGTEVERLSPIAKLIKEGKVGGVYLEPIPVQTVPANSEHDLLAMAQSGLAAAQSAAVLAQVGIPGNIESPGQVRRLVATLQSFLPKDALPLWVAVEQEGGAVQALRKDLGFAGLMSAARLGQDSVENTEVTARRAGLEMAALGINFVLGPAGDVNVNPLSEKIGQRFRAFSADETQVAAHVQAFGRGFWAAKVMPCLRNYPGTGSYVRGFAPAASSFGQKNILESITDISGSWQLRELVPYEKNLTIPKQVEGEVKASSKVTSEPSFALQPALVYHRGYDAMYPVPLSSKMLTEVVRQQWGFQGLILSQDLRALQPFFSLEESVLQSVLAGADMLFVTEPPAMVDPASSPLAGLGALSSLPGMGNVQALAGLMDKAKNSEADMNEEALIQMLLQNQTGSFLPGVLGAEVKAKPLTGHATQAEKVYAILLQLVKSGRISEARVRQSWLRIHKAKEETLLTSF